MGIVSLLSPWFFFSNSLSFLFSLFPHVLFPPSPPSFSHFFSMTPLCLGVDRVLSVCKYVPSVLLHDWEIGFLPKLFPVFSHRLTPTFAVMRSLSAFILLSFSVPCIIFFPLQLFHPLFHMQQQDWLISGFSFMLQHDLSLLPRGRKGEKEKNGSGGGKREIIIEHAKPAFIKIAPPEQSSMA